MTFLRKKLHNETGSSMLMALLFLLVAILVSVVILSAAISATAAVRSDQAQQQAMLTVSSAAELLRDSLASEEGSYKEITTFVYPYNAKYGTPTTSKTTQEASGNFSEILNNAVKFLGQYPSAISSGTYTIEAQGLESVSMNLKITYSQEDSTYKLRAEFENITDSDHTCRMVLTMSGSQRLTTQSGTQFINGRDRLVEVQTMSLVWENAHIGKE